MSLSLSLLAEMLMLFVVECTDVKKFISCRRYETLSLHQILEGFVVSDCDWLMPDSEQRRVPVTDSLKRREMLEEFLFWYFDSFVLPLLKVRIPLSSYMGVLKTWDPNRRRFT
jgi:hypothetical protein